MKKRIAGGVVLVAIGIGIWLSNLFNGLGPGGAGSNIGMNPEAQVSLENARPAVGGGVPSTTTQETSAEAPLPEGRPIVVIDDQDYFLEDRSLEETRYVPVSLEQIVQQATTAQPDADGIRVQIKRRGSSRPAAETALDAALKEAGIGEEQIQRHAGFVDGEN